ncbi:hypothetical protein FQN55_009625 [Onygenales sp. PD_40]|nr:hypothetical protein FQN55_009625 [Onygenales sp. PD_40]KAK2805886.1 hypothetical protein FQN51_008660 [Onygenales sp. PD_10]
MDSTTNNTPKSGHRFPLPKRSIDSFSLRRYKRPVFDHSAIHSDNASHSNLARRAGSLRFTTPLPKSYRRLLKQQQQQAKKKKKKQKKKKPVATRSKRKPPAKKLTRGQRWAAAAAKRVEALRPSSKVEKKPPPPPQLIYEYAGTIDALPGRTPPRPTQFPFAMPPYSTPARKSSLPQGRKPVPVNKKAASEKPLPNPPKVDTPKQQSTPGSSKSFVGAKDAPTSQSPPANSDAKGDLKALSPVIVPSAANLKNDTAKNKESPIQNQPTVSADATDFVEHSLNPAVTQGITGQSRPQVLADGVSNGHYHVVNQPEVPNNPFDQAHQTNSLAVSPTAVLPNSAIPETPASQSNVELEIETPTTKQAETPTPKPNPFRNRQRKTTSPHNALQQRPQSALRAFSFDFLAGPPSAASGNVNTGQDAVTAEALDAKETANTYSTPRNGSGASRIPRMSPHGVTPTGSEAATNPWTTRSPSRRSSIPIPSRFVHNSEKSNENAQSPASSAAIPGRTFDAIDTSTIYENKSLEDQYDLETQRINHTNGGEANEPTEPYLCNESGMNPASTHSPGGYALKNLSTTARRGPRLRISPDAERVIMGDPADAQPGLSQQSNGKCGKRSSGNRKDFRLSTDSIFGNFAPKYLTHSRSSSSLNASASKDSEKATNEGKKEKYLKKARSTEAAYASLSSRHRMRPRHALAETTSADPLRMHSANPFYNEGDMAPAPSPAGPSSFNERYPTMNGDFDPPRYSEGEPSHVYRHSPLAEGTTLIDENDVIHSRPAPRKKHTVPSPLQYHGSVDQFAHRNGNESPRNENTTSPTIRKRGTPQQSPRQSSRNHGPDHESYGKSKLSHVASQHAIESNRSAVPVGNDTPSGHRHHRKHRDESVKRDSRSTIRDSKPSTSRGVLSNFRGLFTKQKAEPASERQTSTAPKRKDLEKVKATNGGSMSPGSPVDRSPSRYSRYSRRDNKPSTPSRSTHEDHSRTASDNQTISSQMAGSPALFDLGNVSALTMEILTSARDEPDNSKKEKLIRLGKILIEAVNHSHDAEKAMLTAVQAAKEAEVACALAKENAMRMGQIAREWTETSGYYANAF